MSRDGARAYVTSPDGHMLSMLDAASRTVLRQVTLPGGPLGVAVSPDGAKVFVADWYGDQVTMVDAATGASGPAIAVGHSPSGLAVTPDNTLLVVANRLDNTVSLIVLATQQQVAVIPVGEHPFGVTIDPSGTRAYAADVESDDVAVIDLASRRLLTRIPVGKRPYVVALAGGRGFVTNEQGGSLTAFDLATLLPTGSVEVGSMPEGIEASRDGQTLYVANWMDDTISVVDARTLKVAATLPAGDSPRAFGTFLRSTGQGSH